MTEDQYYDYYEDYDNLFREILELMINKFD